jgi:hypothetical protein
MGMSHLSDEEALHVLASTPWERLEAEARLHADNLAAKVRSRRRAPAPPERAEPDALAARPRVSTRRRAAKVKSR